MRVLQNPSKGEIKSMATSTDNAQSDDGLGTRRINGAGNVHHDSERQPDNGPADDNGALAVSEAGDDSGVEVAASESSITWDTEHSIGMRILLAQREVKTLEKDVDVKQTKNKDGKSFGGYKGISADQVVAFGKDMLTKNGILYTADLAEDTPPRKNGNKTEIKITGKFENVDKPDEFRTRSAWGEGNDNSAHGYQKATTNAEKIIIGKMLMMTTVEDEQAPVETQTVSNEVREAKAETEVTVAAWADNFKIALTKCTTLDELQAVRRDNANMLKSDRLPEKTRDYFLDMIAQLEGNLS